MNLTAREDIDAPKDAVFAAVTDFDRFERRLMRRGIDVLRDESHADGLVGLRWRAPFDWKGKRYDIEGELVSIEPDDGFAVEAHSSGLICLGVVDLVALSKTRTRLMVSLDIRATSLSARLLIGSLRLAGGTIEHRFQERVSSFARELPGALG
ncbi:SRPBCC family protein [Alphaproteobacteria bacterium GH1-50]|uniref:SRPBCC family protein n=1 Tax=Kangsaoukella pontilimi TaxID=2691042 RepID=A0A7C9IGP9_9RHOB|nr:SRPBCC family protein [Kangsaoukella pontilimi]MXQ08468.1 SRPBCC family protein [Kangsaoukella pontilimi]